jgi:hypothetical protein
MLRQTARASPVLRCSRLRHRYHHRNQNGYEYPNPNGDVRAHVHSPTIKIHLPAAHPGGFENGGGYKCPALPRAPGCAAENPLAYYRAPPIRLCMRIPLTALLSVALSATVTAASSANRSLTNENIVVLENAGFDELFIFQLIRQSQVVAQLDHFGVRIIMSFDSVRKETQVVWEALYGVA